MKYYETTDQGTAHTNKKIINWEAGELQFGESFIDATGWRPDAEIARAAILTGDTRGAGLKPVYDFPDGRDTGARPLRQSGMDIVDVQMAIENIENTAKDSQKKTTSAKEAQKMLDNAMTEALNQAISNQTGQQE